MADPSPPETADPSPPETTDPNPPDVTPGVPPPEKEEASNAEPPSLNDEDEIVKKPNNLASSVAQAAKSATERGKALTSKGLKTPMDVAKSVARAASKTAKQGTEIAKKVSNGLIETEKKVAKSISGRTSLAGSPKSSNGELSRLRDEVPLQPQEEEGSKDSSVRNVASKEKVTTWDFQTKVESAVLGDGMIIWIVVASIAIVQTMENLSGILSNSFPASTVLAWMLVAFAGGLDIDANVLVQLIKTRALGLKEDETPTLSMNRGVTLESLDEPAELREKPGLQFFLRRVFRRNQTMVRLASIRTATALKRKKSTRQQSIALDVNLMRRLSRFGRKSHEEELTSTSTQPTADEGTTLETETVPHQQEHPIGGYNLNEAKADLLIEKVSVEPLFDLRGLDVFLADNAEEEMSTHPFLLK
jgi:hypothetical protein